MKMEKQEAYDFFAEFYGGDHHFPSELKPFGDGWKMNHHGDLSTFDFNKLTELVLMAHYKCVRVGIMPAMRDLSIVLHKRQREGSIWERHPDMTEAILDYEKSSIAQATRTSQQRREGMNRYVIKRVNDGKYWCDSSSDVEWTLDINRAFMCYKDTPVRQGEIAVEKDSELGYSARQMDEMR